jgi:hypothetical protein
MKMPKLLLLAQAIGCVGLIVYCGCSKESSTTRVTTSRSPATVVNTPPKVSAGATIQMFLPVDSANLSGSAKDAENNISSYRWDQLSGPNQAMIQTPDSLQTKISGLIKGAYRFELTVIDKGGLNEKAGVQVLVFDTANGANKILFQNLKAGCWGGECLLGIDNSLIPLGIPIRVFIKSSDSVAWTEVWSYFWDVWFHIQFGGDETHEAKTWEVMIVY